MIEAVAYIRCPCSRPRALFTRTEGIIPAPESAHAIRAAIDEALDAKAKGEERIIVFNLSGHGFLDLAAYERTWRQARGLCLSRGQDPGGPEDLAAGLRASVTTTVGRCREGPQMNTDRKRMNTDRNP